MVCRNPGDGTLDRADRTRWLLSADANASPRREPSRDAPARPRSAVAGATPTGRHSRRPDRQHARYPKCFSLNGSRQTDRESTRAVIAWVRRNFHLRSRIALWEKVIRGWTSQRGLGVGGIRGQLNSHGGSTVLSARVRWWDYTPPGRSTIRRSADYSRHLYPSRVTAIMPEVVIATMVHVSPGVRGAG